MQKILTRAQVRQFDRVAVEKFEMESLVLMENAARGATDVLCQAQGGGPAQAVLVCGPGNNGGDGLVMARHLHLRGWRAIVILLANPEKLSQDSAANLRILTHTCVEVIDGRRPAVERLQHVVKEADWTVDAILGTGAAPPLRPPLDQIVPMLNNSARRRMAIDIPTGLDCDTVDYSSSDDDIVFEAELTATFVAQKPVMQTEAGKNFCGEIRIVDIGAPPEVFDYLD